MIRTFGDLWELGQFFMLVIPSILVLVGMRFVGASSREGWERRRLLFLMASTVVSLGLLDLLILTNPYGREVSSSLTAIGMLPVLVACLVTLFNLPEELRQLWVQEKWLLLALGAVTVVLLGLLWWLEPPTLYVVLAPTVVMSLALLLAQKASLTWILLLTLSIVVGTLWLGGGLFWIPDMFAPAWQAVLRSFLLGATVVLSIFLPAALLYVVLRGEDIDERRLYWSLALSAVLVCCTLYQVYWDGIWSAAHARAYEDHLPFAQFVLSLMAGVMLALLLRGRRRWIGPAYTLCVVLLCIGALSAGWRVSAFEVTEQRAEKIMRAIKDYEREHGPFPTELGVLTPGYLLFLPPPVVVRQGGWCYQGDEDGYRLGYISGDFTYFESNFHTEVVGEAGAPPVGGAWRCDAMLEMLKVGGATY